VGSFTSETARALPGELLGTLRSGEPLDGGETTRRRPPLFWGPLDAGFRLPGTGRLHLNLTSFPASAATLWPSHTEAVRLRSPKSGDGDLIMDYRESRRILWKGPLTGDDDWLKWHADWVLEREIHHEEPPVLFARGGSDRADTAERAVDEPAVLTRDSEPASAGVSLALAPPSEDVAALAASMATAAAVNMETPQESRRRDGSSAPGSLMREETTGLRDVREENPLSILGSEFEGVWYDVAEEADVGTPLSPRRIVAREFHRPQWDEYDDYDSADRHFVISIAKQVSSGPTSSGEKRRNEFGETTSEWFARIPAYVRYEGKRPPQNSDFSGKYLRAAGDFAAVGELEDGEIHWSADPRTGAPGPVKWRKLYIANIAEGLYEDRDTRCPRRISYARLGSLDMLDPWAIDLVVNGADAGADPNTGKAISCRDVDRPRVKWGPFKARFLLPDQAPDTKDGRMHLSVDGYPSSARTDCPFCHRGNVTTDGAVVVVPPPWDGGGGRAREVLWTSSAGRAWWVLTKELPSLAELSSASQEASPDGGISASGAGAEGEPGARATNVESERGADTDVLIVI